MKRDERVPDKNDRKVALLIYCRRSLPNRSKPARFVYRPVGLSRCDRLEWNVEKVDNLPTRGLKAERRLLRKPPSFPLIFCFSHSLSFPTRAAPVCPSIYSQSHTHLTEMGSSKIVCFCQTKQPPWPLSAIPTKRRHRGPSVYTRVCAFNLVIRLTFAFQARCHPSPREFARIYSASIGLRNQISRIYPYSFVNFWSHNGFSPG